MTRCGLYVTLIATYLGTLMMNKNLLTHQLQNSLRQLLNGRTFVLLGQTGQVE